LQKEVTGEIVWDAIPIDLDEIFNCVDASYIVNVSIHWNGICRKEEGVVRDCDSF